MPCYTIRASNQTLTERKTQVRETVTKLAAALVAGTVKPKVGPQGAIAFQGWTEQDRNRVTDVCAYRQIMSSGSAMAKLKIAQAEQLAGRPVSKQVLAQGGHYHGDVYHSHKG
jgi:hypothetical protein